MRCRCCAFRCSFSPNCLLIKFGVRSFWWCFLVSGNFRNAGDSTSPCHLFFRRKVKAQRIQAILALYLIVLLFLSSIFWFFGGKILHQTREIAGSVREWPTLLEEKAEDNLPADLWQGISSHVDAFKEYWTGLVGKRDHSEFQKLSRHNKKFFLD